MTKPLLIHGTCVDIKGNGVLISGKSGIGKSSLALQLIDRGAILITDDQVLLSLEKEGLLVKAPGTLKGLMEVRGIGICTFPFQETSFLKLCVKICEDEELERLPDPLFIEYYKIKVPCLKIKKNDLLGAIKVELKLCDTDEYDAS